MGWGPVHALAKPPPPRRSCVVASRARPAGAGTLVLPLPYAPAERRKLYAGHALRICALCTVVNTQQT